MKRTVIFLLILVFSFFNCCLTELNEKKVRDKNYWHSKNYELIRRRISYFNLRPEALVRVKNVIIFIGDGMGLTTITASRMHKKQNSNNFEETKLVFDEFPTSALIQTDTANSQISESAAAATALFCGVKTNLENLGVDETAGKETACSSSIDSHTPSIMSWAQKRNLKTGFVTTARITHATPAALYAHSRRHFEDDSKSDSNCKDIARQLIENLPGKKLNVIMGGGLRSFTCDPPGRRQDCRNLTTEWLEEHRNGEFIENRSQMMNISSDTEHVLGIFASSHMHFNFDRNKEEEPSLAEMTDTAIKILKRKNSNGFLLMVEGGKIDLAHHFNNAFRALDDTLALDEAVEVALRSVDLSESMIIVTSDHASAMTYSGYATPKNYPILGMDKYLSNVNRKPYQLLTYSSGIGHENYNETTASSDHKNSYHKATIPSTWSNHAASDVPLYAIGSLSNLLFSGTLEQNYIPHAIAFAMCLFKYQDRCVRKPQKPFEYSKEVPRSKFHQLKHQLKIQREMNQKVVETALENVEVEPSPNTWPEITDDITDFETYTPSDLVGNSTNETCESQSCGNAKDNAGRIYLKFDVVIFVVMFVILVV